MALCEPNSLRTETVSNQKSAGAAEINHQVIRPLRGQKTPSVLYRRSNLPRLKAAALCSLYRFSPGFTSKISVRPCALFPLCPSESAHRSGLPCRNQWRSTGSLPGTVCGVVRSSAIPRTFASVSRLSAQPPRNRAPFLTASMSIGRSLRCSNGFSPQWSTHSRNPYSTSPTSRLPTPHRTITRMGFHFKRRRAPKAAAKSTIPTQLAFTRAISAPPKAT